MLQYVATDFLLLWRRVLSNSTSTKWQSNSSNTTQKSYSIVEIQQCWSVCINITPYSMTTLKNKQFACLFHPLATIWRALQISSIHCIQGRHVVTWLVVMHFPAHKGKKFLCRVQEMERKVKGNATLSWKGAVNQWRSVTCLLYISSIFSWYSCICFVVLSLCSLAADQCETSWILQCNYKTLSPQLAAVSHRAHQWKTTGSHYSVSVRSFSYVFIGVDVV